MWQENEKMIYAGCLNTCNAISEIHSLRSLESKSFLKNNEVNFNRINNQELSFISDWVDI